MLITQGKQGKPPKTQGQWIPLSQAALFLEKSEDYLRKICRYSLQNPDQSPFNADHFYAFGEEGRPRYQINLPLFQDILTKKKKWRSHFNKWRKSCGQSQNSQKQRSPK
jgi:hypothetical protein